MSGMATMRKKARKADMERLTVEGHVYHDCEFMDSGMAVYMNQLSAFEDIGMAPEEFKKPVTVDALLFLTASVVGIDVNRLRELVHADKDGRLVVLPCGPDVELTKDGKIFKADHWNVNLTAFRDEPANRSGLQVALFSVEEAAASLRENTEEDEENCDEDEG